LDCELTPEQRRLTSSIVSHTERRFDAADNRGIARQCGIDRECSRALNYQYGSKRYDK
jgi:hypothetical protein